MHRLSKAIDETVIFAHQGRQSADVMAVDPIYKLQSDIYGAVLHGALSLQQ
jgi:hypothetical protein